MRCLLTTRCSVWQAADKAIAAAQQGQAESAAELDRFKERSDAIQRRVAASGSMLQQVLCDLCPCG